MPVELLELLYVLVCLAIGTLILVNVKLLTGGFSKPATPVVTSAPDNIYTQLASVENRKAAEAAERAQTAALRAAELNTEIEKIKLERAKYSPQLKD